MKNMKPIIISDDDVVGLSNPEKKWIHLAISGRKFDDLRTVLRRAMNTMDPIPPWLLDLQSSMEMDPVPFPVDLRTGEKWKASK